MDNKAEFVTLERSRERTFLDLFKVHAKDWYGLDILACFPRDETIQFSDLETGTQKWMGAFQREFKDGDHIFPGFLDGHAESHPKDVLFAIKEP